MEYLKGIYNMSFAKYIIIFEREDIYGSFNSKR